MLGGMTAALLCIPSLSSEGKEAGQRDTLRPIGTAYPTSQMSLASASLKPTAALKGPLIQTLSFSRKNKVSA